MLFMCTRENVLCVNVCLLELMQKSWAKYATIRNAYALLSFIHLVFPLHKAHIHKIIFTNY